MTGPSRTFRSELARVRGLGSAKTGAHHWWMQRVTALALVPLTMWFVVSVVIHLRSDMQVLIDPLIGAQIEIRGLSSVSYVGIRSWLSSPLTFALMVLLIAAMFHHAQLGLQVVIEDYVHRESVKIVAILLVKLASLALAVCAIVALMVIAFRDSPQLIPHEHPMRLEGATTGEADPHCCSAFGSPILSPG